MFEEQTAIEAGVTVSLSARHRQAGPPDRWSFGRGFAGEKIRKRD